MNYFVIIILYQATQAYQDLIVIIKHPDFNPNDAIENLRRFKTWRKRLPLQMIKSHKIPINGNKTPSTYCTEKPAYIFSIKEHLHRV